MYFHTESIEGIMSKCQYLVLTLPTYVSKSKVLIKHGGEDASGGKPAARGNGSSVDPRPLETLERRTVPERITLSVPRLLLRFFLQSFSFSYFYCLPYTETNSNLPPSP